MELRPRQAQVQVGVPAAHLLQRVVRELDLLDNLVRARVLDKLKRLGKSATRALYCSEARPPKRNYSSHLAKQK